MPTAYRETIMAALSRELLDIVADTGQTWATTVAPKVYRSRKNAAEAVLYPFLFLSAKDETYGLRATSSAYRQYDRTMRVGIEFYIEGFDLDTQASKVVHDVELALSDFTLGGIIEDLYFESNRILQGDTDTVPLAGVEFVVVIRYRTNNNTPAARA